MALFTLPILLLFLLGTINATPVATPVDSSNPVTNTVDKPPFNLPDTFSLTTEYPLANEGHVHAHDPNIIESNNTFYLFMGGVHLPYFKASNISGPWEHVGTVLQQDSIIGKINSTRPWAPTTVARNGLFYCFYTVSKRSTRNSAIGVATSDTMEAGSWTDHGALVYTKQGPNSHHWPYTVSNAIDPAYIEDNSTGQPYLLYGSFWHGIFQVPLEDDLLSVKDAEHPDAKNLVYIPDEKVKPAEGSFMSYHAPYYYVWFSRGKCCHFTNGFPKMGKEYSIRMGRSKDVRGPFEDKEGKALEKGGGTIVYGSNHGEVYAPGGLGVLPGDSDRPDILYYHYLNTSIGFDGGQAHLGYSYLDYDDGWPVPKGYMPTSPGSILRPNYALNVFTTIVTVLFIWLSV